eukprot:11025845-Ditylum_brightwellii.AAC.1
MPPFNNFMYQVDGYTATPPQPQLAAAAAIQPPARTPMNNYSQANTYVNNCTTPSQETQYIKTAFQLFYPKLVDPLQLAFLNFFVHSWGQFKAHIEAECVRQQLRKL